MSDQFDVWMDFCESLRPDLDNICFYPDAILPLKKSLIFEMLAEIYHDHKNDKDNLRQLQSIAVNVGYLGRFTEGVTKKHLTISGSRLTQLQTIDTDDPEALLNMMEASKGDPKKDEELLLGFASTLLTFCKLTGFDLNDMITWNELIGMESSMAVKNYHELSKK
jgi:hypothetical protein